MKKYVYLTGVLLLSLASCTKQNQNFKNSIQKAGASSAFSQLYPINPLIPGSPANADNPYDSFGLIHNQICISTQNVWDVSGFSLQDSQDVKQLYSADTGAFFSLGLTSNTIPSYIDFKNMVNETINDTGISYEVFINQSNLPILVKSYALQLYDKFDSLDETDSFESYIASFATVEGEIGSNNNLSQSDKEFLLKTASVFRYSSVLWINYLYSDLGETSTAMAASDTGGNFWHRVGAFFAKHKKQISGAVGADAGELFNKDGLSGWGKVIEVVGKSIAGYVNTKP